MKSGPPEYSLVRNHLLIRKVGDEVIIYDSKTHKAHCLNNVAASVWQLWEAQKSVREICVALEQTDEQKIWTILSELRSAGLLMNPIPGIADDNRLSRRELAKKAGVGIALTATFLTSVIVPPPASAVTPHRPPRRSIRKN